MKDILIDAIKGTDGPYYGKVMSKCEQLGLGRYCGGFLDRWEWNGKTSFERLNEEELKNLYKEVKESWNK